MKKLILLLLLIVGSFQGFSQTPGISYQAVILNPNVKELPGVNAQTNILTNSKVVVQFTISDEFNSPEYQEYHQTSTDAYGMINLLIGHGTSTNSDDFEDIVWNGLSKKLKIDIDFTGSGSNFTLLNEQELTFMPQPALVGNANAILNNTADIIAEIARATNVESRIQLDVDTNQITSELADTNLGLDITMVQNDVDANESVSVASDTKLQSNIDTVQFNLSQNQTATQTVLDLKVDKVIGKGLSSEDYSTVDKTKLAAISGTNTGDQDLSSYATTTNLALKANIMSPTFTGTVSGITKSMVGLGNVDNTSDADKAVSTAAQTALDLKVDKVTGKGLSTEDYTTAEKAKLAAISGTNTGDQDLSSYATTTNLALKANIMSPTFTGTVSGITKSMVGLGNVDNTSDADKAVSTAAQTALDLKANLVSPALTGVPVAPTATAGANTTQIATTAFVTSAVTGNYVDLTTNQTIAGAKSFSSDLTINNTKFGRGSGTNLNSRNIAIGNSSLNNNTSGQWNTGIGTYALQKNTTSSSNTAFGNEAISESVPGSNNTGLGSRALMFTSGSGNTSVGTNALIRSTTGNSNTVIGYNAFSTNTLGSNNTAIGASTVVSSVGLTNVTVLGYGATVATDNTIQLGNTSVTLVNTSGAITSGGAITGSSIVKSGGTASQFLKADGSVDANTYLTSTSAGSSFVDLTTNQTIAGTKTFSNDIVVNGVKIGRGNGNNDHNTVLGGAALGTGTGTRNTAVGYAALKDYSGTSFDNNTSIGYFNLPSLTTGSGNTSVGAESMLGLLTGTSNTSIGNQSLINTLGDNNVGIGKSSGSVITNGSNNTIVGTEANVLTNSQNNATAIGFQAIASGDNTIQLGNTNVTLVNTSGAITSGGIITGTTIVKSGGTSSQYLMADGSVSNGAAAVREVADEFSATADQTNFTLTQTPSTNSKVKMFVNGIRISNTAYSISGTILTYLPANNGGYDLTASDRIQMDFYY